MKKGINIDIQPDRVDKQKGEKKNKALIFVNVTITVIIAIVIFGFVSYVNGRHFVHFDFTANKKFTLSSKTKNILKGLKKPVNITVLFDPGEIFYNQINDILDEYDYLSKMVTINRIDPLRERTKAEELAKELKVEALELNSIVIQSEERSKHVLQKDVIERAFPFKFIGEEVFTSSILSVAEGRQTGLFFTIGHGEREADEFERHGFSSVVEGFKRDNFKVIDLDLLVKKEIPATCAVLVIAGPSKAFATEEVNIIRKYLDEGGKLLVMLEPAISPNAPSGLKSLLAEYGVRLRDDVVIYNKVNMPMFGLQLVTEVYVSKDEYQEHKITKDMKKLTTVFFGACAIESAPSHETTAFGSKKYITKPLAYAPDQAWGELTIKPDVKPVFHPDEDVSGPISLAVAIEPADPNAIVGLSGQRASSMDKITPEGTRIVVFTDVDFAANQFIRKPGNQDMIMNSVNWLAQKETQLGISGKTPEFRTASFNHNQMKIIFWLSIGALPLITIITGGIVWWKRRR